MPWYRRLAIFTVIVVFAYSVPLAVYSTFAWLRLRPTSWAENEIPALDPLGTAWEQWRPSPANTAGEGTLADIATEQGDRWKWTLISTAIAIILAIAATVALRMTRSQSKLPCGTCGYDLLESVRGRVITCPSCGREA